MTNTDNTNAESNGYEKKDVNLKKIFITLLISILFVVVSILFIMDYYSQLKQQVYYDQVLKPNSEFLNELNKREYEELNSYRLIDSTTETYQIPIDSAIKYMIEKEKGQN